MTGRITQMHIAPTGEVTVLREGTPRDLTHAEAALRLARWAWFGVRLLGLVLRVGWTLLRVGGRAVRAGVRRIRAAHPTGWEVAATAAWTYAALAVTLFVVVLVLSALGRFP